MLLAVGSTIPLKKLWALTNSPSSMSDSGMAVPWGSIPDDVCHVRITSKRLKRTWTFDIRQSMLVLVVKLWNLLWNCWDWQFYVPLTLCYLDSAYMAVSHVYKCFVWKWLGMASVVKPCQSEACSCWEMWYGLMSCAWHYTQLIICFSGSSVRACTPEGCHKFPCMAVKYNSPSPLCQWHTSLVVI